MRRANPSIILILLSANGPGGQALNSRTAFQLELQLDQVARELRVQFNELGQLQSELDVARQRMETTAIRRGA